MPDAPIRARGFHNALQRKLWASQGRNFACVYCGVPLSRSPCPSQADRRLTRDHVLPRSQGGRTTVPACLWCNRCKAHTDLDTWLASQALQQRRSQVQGRQDVVPPWDGISWALFRAQSEW